MSRSGPREEACNLVDPLIEEVAVASFSDVVRYRKGVSAERRGEKMVASELFRSGKRKTL